MAEKKASNGTGARTSSKDTRKVHGSEGKKGRVDDEPTEEMIRNVMHFGVIEPIVVRKNQETGKTEVVAGRMRAKACREANRRLVARGEAPLRIPAVVIRPTAAKAIGTMISENEHRSADVPMNKAEKVARMIDRGATLEDAGISLGLKVPQVKNLLALIDAPAFIRSAVDSEKVTLSNGIKIARLVEAKGPEEGRKLIEKLIEQAPRTPGRKRSPNSRKANEIVDGPGMRSKREIAAMMGRLTACQLDFDVRGQEGRVQAIAEALAWVLGVGELTGLAAVPPLAVASGQ